VKINFVALDRLQQSFFSNLPFQTPQHLHLHHVNLLQREQPLGSNPKRFIRITIVHPKLTREDQSRKDKLVVNEIIGYGRFKLETVLDSSQEMERMKNCLIWKSGTIEEIS
jgi:hypothetical protein